MISGMGDGYIRDARELFGREEIYLTKICVLKHIS